MKSHFKIGSRGSKLALYQAALVKSKLEEAFPKYTFEIVKIQTKGDKNQKGAIASLGRGVFTREIEEALIAEEIEFAVHSAKDMETELPDGLVIGAMLERDDTRDAFLAKGKKLSELEARSKVGTSSLRRKAQVKHIRPDLSVLDLRGNVETRVQKLQNGEYDGIIMAAAGLKRLGLSNLITEVLDESKFLTQAGQGAIAVQVCGSNEETKKMAAAINHELTDLQVKAERSFLRSLFGGCQVPIGVRSRVKGETLDLEGAVFSSDGKKEVRRRISGPKQNAEALGVSLGKEILKAGGREILDEIRTNG